MVQRTQKNQVMWGLRDTTRIQVLDFTYSLYYINTLLKVLLTSENCLQDQILIKKITQTIQFNLFRSQHFMIHEVLYTIMYKYINIDSTHNINYGGQTFSYILDNKMHNLIRTL